MISFVISTFRTFFVLLLYYFLFFVWVSSSDLRPNILYVRINLRIRQCLSKKKDETSKEKWDGRIGIEMNIFKFILWKFYQFFYFFWFTRRSWEMNIKNISLLCLAYFFFGHISSNVTRWAFFLFVCNFWFLEENGVVAEVYNLLHNLHMHDICLEKKHMIFQNVWNLVMNQ